MISEQNKSPDNNNNLNKNLLVNKNEKKSINIPYMSNKRSNHNVLKSDNKNTQSKRRIIHIEKNGIKKDGNEKVVENDHNNISNEIKNSIEEIKKFEDKNNKLSAENQNLKNTIVKKDNEIKNLKKQIDDSKKSEKKLNDKINLLQKDNNKIKNDNKTLEKKVNELSEELERII